MPRWLLRNCSELDFMRTQISSTIKFPLLRDHSHNLPSFESSRDIIRLPRLLSDPRHILSPRQGVTMTQYYDTRSVSTPTILILRDLRDTTPTRPDTPNLFLLCLFARRSQAFRVFCLRVPRKQIRPSRIIFTLLRTLLHC